MVDNPFNNQSAADLLEETPEVNDDHQESGDNSQATNSSTPEWMESISNDELKNSNYLKRFGSVEDLAKAVVESKQTLSKKLVNKPDENSTPEEIEAFYRELGAPEKPEDYKLDGIAIEVNGEKQPIEFNDAGKDRLLQIAHKANLTQQQVEMAARAIAELETSIPEMTVSRLREDWGDKADKYYKIASRTFESMPEELRNEVAKEVGLQPSVAKMLVWMADKMGEDMSLPRNSVKTPRSGMESMESIQAQVDEVLSSPEYKNPLDPGHRAAQDKFKSLIEKKVKLAMQK